MAAPHGERHGKAALSDAEVLLMRSQHKPGLVGYETLAKRFGCGASTARDICTYRTRITAGYPPKDDSKR
ncbi:hypothetical protein GCM10028811_12970 [Uliginosibacterium sediminicola]